MKKLSIFFIAFLLLSANAIAASLPYIDKSKIRLSITPGEKKYGEINVQNPNEDPRTIRLYLEDWRYISLHDGSKEFLPVGSTARSGASWINFSPAEFTIPPFGRQRISYSVDVPQDAVGGYYAALFFETTVGQLPTSETKATDAGIDLKVRIATLFYIETAGTAKRSIAVNGFSARKEPASGFLVELDLKNSGNVDLTVSGSFYMMDDNGLVLARGEFNPAYTFAGESAKLSGKWKERIPQGEYNLVVTLDLNKAQYEPQATLIPSVVKETRITIGADGQVSSMGELE